MTTEDLTTSEISPAATPARTAGALLREYRENKGLLPDSVATALHVPTAKLQALEEDRLAALPDIMFARALAQAVCRHLKADPAPVLALLPGQDTSRLAPKSERGIDSPLHRPSFMPQTGAALMRSFVSPMRMGALVVLFLAVVVALWPSTQDSAVTQEATVPVHVAPVPDSAASDAMPMVPAVDPASASVPSATSNMVVTPVQPAMGVAPATTPASAGVPNVR